MHNAENMVLLGPPWVGKTHLAIAFGLEAVTGGHSVSFSPVFDAMNRLKKAEPRGRFDFAMRGLV